MGIPAPPKDGPPLAVNLNSGDRLQAFAPSEFASAMNKLVFANLLHRPLRSIISVLAVAIEVIMILSVQGIFLGILNDTRTRTNGIGADLMMMGSGASFFNGLSAASMPVNDAIALRRLPHVALVSPAIQYTVTLNGSPQVLWGIDYDTFDAMKPFVFLSGGRFSGPYDVIIDQVLAGADHYHVGDTLQLLDHSFRITGIVEPGKGGRRMIPMATLAQLLGEPGKASIFYIRCDKPADETLVTNEVHATPGFGNNSVITIDDWLNQMTPDRIPGFNIAVRSVTGIAVVVGFLVIFQAMYTAILERTREIGILKSMGASKPAIVGVVLRECGALAALGVVVGIAGTFGVRQLFLYLAPTQHFEITVLLGVQAAAIAFVGALCGALYPAWMAARKDPIDALAYE